MRKKWEEISTWLIPSVIYVGIVYFAIKSGDAASDKEFTAAIYWLLVAAIFWRMLRNFGRAQEVKPPADPTTKKCPECIERDPDFRETLRLLY